MVIGSGHNCLIWIARKYPVIYLISVIASFNFKLFSLKYSTANRMLKSATQQPLNRYSPTGFIKEKKYSILTFAYKAGGTNDMHSMESFFIFRSNFKTL